MKRFKGKHSLKKQLLLYISMIMVLVLGAGFLMNNFLLEHYYMLQKQQTLETVYKQLNSFTDAEDYKTQEFADYFQHVTDNYNLEINILYPDDDGQFESVYESRSNRVMRGRVEGYLFGFHSEDEKKSVIKSNDAYVIQQYFDSYAENEFLESFGMLDNGCYFLMRIALQSIKDSAQISNRFSAYLLVFGLVISILLSLWISSRITKPIDRLTELSEKMANLEFDVKYEGKEDNEIGRLGSNFNQLSSKLEQTISELKTANNELRSDLDRKNEIEQMRKDFLSNVTHELKTPLALIQGYAEGLMEFEDDPESRAYYCEVIIDEAGKMNRMVKQMLSLNQLESGRDLVALERFDLCEVIKGVASSSKILAEQKGADIQLDLFLDTIYVWGDEFKIEEVLTNYVSNAVHHVEGENKILITARKNGKNVRVTVFNTGKQIPDGDIENVWVKFYKVDKARTREYGGSGIGLSIVKAIMDAHHQKYGVENREDGVAFWFELDCNDEGVEIE